MCGRVVSGRLASAEKHGCEQPLFHGAGVRGRGEGEGPVPPEVQLLALPVLSEARVPAPTPEYTENGAMRSRFLLDVRYDLSSLYIIRCEEGLLVFVVFLPILPIPEKNTDLRKCISQRLQIKQIVENGGKESHHNSFFPTISALAASHRTGMSGFSFGGFGANANKGTSTGFGFGQSGFGNANQQGFGGFGNTAQQQQPAVNPVSLILQNYKYM